MIKMIGSKLLAGLTAFAALYCLSQVAPVLAEDVAPKADVVGSASSPSHKSPIQVKVVDYQKAEEGPGTLKMSGKAIAGRDVFISVDNKPFAQVKAAEDGSWSVEDKIPLGDKPHAVRVQQFDEVTQMPAAAAMFSMSLARPTAAELADPPSGR
ncbi:MAG: hypothetical protein QNJ62_12335 [Methyloceanibacter sp.]|nr:hypothetical protein [Methyloceanibacter sp.]